LSAIQTKKAPEGSLITPPRQVSVRRILVPTDFSAGAENAFNYAVGLSGLCQAEISLLHVFNLPEYLTLLSQEAEVDAETSLRILETAKNQAAKKLENAVAGLGGKGPTVIPCLLVGVPSEEIIRFAAEKGIDLIVMSTHGRTALAHFLLGSTSQRVISHAPCPVLTVRI
jgi:universal stress protein A